MAKSKNTTLENYLAGKPLNRNMARLMKGEEDEDRQPEGPRIVTNFADGTPLTDHDRRHLERMLGSAGWQVLLKLLDTKLQHQEDSARAQSLKNPLTRKDEIAAMWAQLSADKEARNRIVALAEGEVEILKATRKTA